MPSTRDGMGSMRLLFPTLELLETSLAAELAERGRFSRNAQPTQGLKQLVVVLDDGYVTGDERLITDAGLDSVTVLDLNGPRDGAAARRSLQLVVDGDDVGGAHRGGRRAVRHPRRDHHRRGRDHRTAHRPVPARQRRAHRQPGIRLAGRRPGADGVAEDSRRRRDRSRTGVACQRHPRERLRVPDRLSRPTGQPLELDIKESAEGGMGPHGLCIGATGSGKSEFLRTLVLSMITSHSPETLNLMLVDFKGGATFLGLGGHRAHRGDHHQPRRRADHGRPDA